MVLCLCLSGVPPLTAARGDSAVFSAHSAAVLQSAVTPPTLPNPSVVPPPEPPALGGLWTAATPSHFYVVQAPLTATSSERITAAIAQGIYNGSARPKGALVWLNEGDGAFVDSYWPSVYSTTYHVPYQTVSLTSFLSSVLAAGRPIGPTIIPGITPTVQPTLVSTITPSVTPTVQSTAVVTGTTSSTPSPTATVLPTTTLVTSATVLPTSITPLSATLTPTSGLSIPTVGTVTPLPTSSPIATSVSTAVLPITPSLPISVTTPITRYVIWDPKVPATINIASTLAGVYGVLAIAPTDEDDGLNLHGLGYTRWIDFRGIFKGRDDAMAWALRVLAPLCSKRAIATLGVSDHGEDSPRVESRDYAVAAREFQFSVPPASGLYDAVINSFPRRTIVMGFDPSDQKTFTYKDSRRGDVGLNTELARNLSFHSAFHPRLINRQADENPTTVRSDPQKVYLAFTISDGDAVGLASRFYNNSGDRAYQGLWRDPLRGSLPLGWSISPVMAQLQGAVLQQLYNQRTANDYFVSWLPGGYYNYSALPSDVQSSVLTWDQANMSAAGLRVGWTYDHDQQGRPVFSAAEAAAYSNAFPTSIGWVQGYSDQGAYLNPERYTAPLFEGQHPKAYLSTAVAGLGDEPEYTEFKINNIADTVSDRPLFLMVNFIIWHLPSLTSLVHIYQALQAMHPGRYQLVTPGRLMALADASLSHGERVYQPLLYPYHSIGHNDGEGWSADANNGTGTLVDGPFWTTLQPGPHVAAFHIMIGNNTAADDQVAQVSIVDAAAGRILAALPLYRRDFTAVRTYQDVQLPFVINLPDRPIAFRTTVLGRAYLKEDRVTVSPAQFWAATSPGVQHDVGEATPAGWQATPLPLPGPLNNLIGSGFLARIDAGTSIPVGTHVATWRLTVDNAAADNAVVATLIIYDRTSHQVVAQRDLRRQDFAYGHRPQDFSLLFSIPPLSAGPAHHLEMQTYWWNHAAITQDTLVVRD